MTAERTDLVLGISADAATCRAVSGAGGLGVLDLGVGDRLAREALSRLATGSYGTSVGVRVPVDCALTVEEVTDLLGPQAHRVDIVVLDWDSPWQVSDIPNRCCVLVEATSLAEALLAAELGADGVIARGNDADGRVSDLGSFVLLQQLVGSGRLSLPVWLCGGIGPHTAAAVVIGGATGVVLDSQLELLPERYGTVSRSVRAVRSAVNDALRPDHEAVLVPGSTLAQRLGTALPVVQGPMTRVSDQPAFAAAVAEQGGLPFLALALASSTQTRSMLEQTRAALDERPWGVGVLGFAPPDVRAAQLEVISELRPPFALIAGGRPDQAAALEDLGIQTFLHVPSPGLLAQFLDAGARRFVFEGAECGGHIGPRSSFSLWEAQLGVLDDFLAAGGVAAELQLLFAGGVHDARSAAMVGAMTEPLARLGVGVGVLIGTGYLFTEEAVSSGAVLPVFQRQVIGAERTELLRTAPGHATRCVPSPFTDSFRSIADGLRAGGVPERDTWERLEQLNVGRLRLASKGLRRSGAELVDVPEREQLDEGLFMAGQVAVLRSSVTTIARLHAEVTTEAAAFRAARAAALRKTVGWAEEVEPSPVPLDVAIVGMACMFPGAPDLASFWSNVVGNVDSITEVPAERWDTGIYYSDAPGDTSRTPSKWGGFLPSIPFDALRYGIPPATLAAIEPVQLLALEAAQRALVDAGYGDGGFDRSRTSVVFGAEAYSDLANATNLRITLPAYLGSVPPELDAQLPRLTEDSFPGRLTNVIAGRIANRLDLGGASFAIDAACGSALAAVDAACKELACGGSDLVLCGGADLHNGIEDYLLFASVGALSPTGSCKTFDASADGIALGEGIACVVLKRLADAERDGDRIYAVIKGVGSGSDGRALGLTAPNSAGQRRALSRAYRVAGISPASVGLLEAHGTGTVVGDRTELKTLTGVFHEAGAAPGACVLGSVKSQIGHTKCAAGLAGLIKSALAVHTGVKPPTLHVSTPNPAWDDGGPFAFQGTAMPWLAEPADRRAGVSAFGFGGTNFHTVLVGHGSAEINRHGLRQWPAELFLFQDKASVERMIARVVGNDAHGRPWSVRDLARTAAVRRESGPVSIAIVASDHDELGELLRAAAADHTDPARGLYRAGSVTPTGKLAMLFPGQGSQRPGMLAELFVAFPELHHLARLGGPELAALFPAAAFDAEALRGQEDRLRDTRAAQPALGIAGLAAHELLSRLGVSADMYAGHSYGELVALAAAGTFDARTLLAISGARAAAILRSAGADPGGMAAVSAGRDEVEKALADAGLAGQVVVANHNAPDQVVISGPSEPLAAALRILPARSIPVACAFHSPVVRGAVDELAAFLATQPVGLPDRPVWTNRAAARYPRGVDEIRAELAAQVGSPVRFVDQIEAMYADGARIFLEAGPGQVLTGLVGKILADRPHTAVSLETSAAHGIRGLLRALAQLAVAGVDLSLGYLYTGRDARDVSHLSPPARPGWTVDGQLVRAADGNPVPNGLAPARRITLSAESTRDTMVGDFLRTTRELVAAQRDIMLSYLGSAPAALPEAPSPEPEVIPEPLAPQETDLLGTVVGVIAARTGYPADMIDRGLDLEADLSVDSIKRTEIAGELTKRLRLPGSMDELVKARTAGDLVAALSGTPSSEPVIAGQPPSRFVLEPVETFDGHIDPVGLLGATIVVAGGDSGLAEELAGQLSARGAVPIVVPGRPVLDERWGQLDGLISLHALEDAAEPLLPSGFAMFKSAVVCQPRWCVAAAPPDAGGLRGFFRALHRELPDTLVRLVEVEPAAPAEGIAGAVAVELQIRVGEPVIGVRGEQRFGFRLVPRDIGSGGPGRGLSSESVVLLIGGARGIAAGVARALADRGCRIELAGRTDHPSRAGYHRVDVLDAEAVRHLVKQVHAEHGRLDGVVYAAGVIEDALVVNKDPASFDRVFRTKVDGAAALLAGLDDLPERPGFVVLFGSIAAALGNRGQADYAAANDALESLGVDWAARTGSRVLTVHWGPWAPTGDNPGMVTPALARSYTERGISLIDPEAGVAALLDELTGGGSGPVIYTASGW